MKYYILWSLALGILFVFFFWSNAPKSFILSGKKEKHDTSTSASEMKNNRGFKDIVNGLQSSKQNKAEAQKGLTEDQNDPHVWDESYIKKISKQNNFKELLKEKLKAAPDHQRRAILKSIGYHSDKISKEVVILKNMQAALVQYYVSNGQLPKLINKDILLALTGENSQHTVYYAPNENEVNEHGQIIDQWGTPLAFNQLDETHIEIRIAGANRQYEDHDDIVRILDLSYYGTERQ